MKTWGVIYQTEQSVIDVMELVLAPDEGQAQSVLWDRLHAAGHDSIIVKDAYEVISPKRVG